MTQKKTFLKIFGLTVKNILPPSLWYMNARREVIFMRIKASKLLAAVLAALAAWGIARARRTPADTVRAEFRALYKKMCRCGLGEGVSSDQEEFKQFLWEHTKTAAPQDVETLLALVQTAQFAPGPVSAQTAQQVRGLCRILRKNLHR